MWPHGLLYNVDIIVIHGLNERTLGAGGWHKRNNNEDKVNLKDSFGGLHVVKIRYKLKAPNKYDYIK